MLKLAIRLGILITEIERLPVPVLMEYVAMLIEADKPEGEESPPQDLEAQLDLMRKQRQEIEWRR